MKVITCSVRYFCVGVLLIFLGSVLLCAFGFTVVLPYEATHFWPQTTCHVRNASYTSRYCSCEKQEEEPYHYMQPNGRGENAVDSLGSGECTEKYPCLQIAVTYNISQAHKEQFAGLENYTTSEHIAAFVYRSWADAFFKTVSVIRYVVYIAVSQCQQRV